MDLRGASADSLAELATQLREAVRAGEHAQRVAADLYGVAELLRAEPALRRIATDVSTPAEAKQGLATQVLEGKVDEVTLALITSAVGHRWTATRDLPSALERLSEIAVVRSVGSQSDQLVDELFALGQIVNGSPELRDALANPARTIADKAALLDSLLSGKALPATVALAQQALGGTYGTITTALSTYRQVAAQAGGESVATVRVVHPLSEADRKRLVSALGAQYGRRVHLNEVVDPDVLGGMRVEIGDDVIDGSVSSRLDDARRKLVG